MGECLSRIKAGAPHVEAPVDGLAAAKYNAAIAAEYRVQPSAVGQKRADSKVLQSFQESEEDMLINAQLLRDSAFSATQPSKQSGARPALTAEASALIFKRIRQPEKLAEASFKARYPEYAATEAALLRLRAEEYDELEKQQHIYLDSTGSALASKKQIAEHFALLQRSLLGNPHSSAMGSTNPGGPAAKAEYLVEEARKQVLRFFNTTPQEYTVVFTPNATGALKLVGESFPFSHSTPFLLCEDSHNSVNGIQSFAHRKGAAVTRVRLTRDAHMEETALTAALRQCGPRGGLFAYPAQSNLTGVKHSLGWIETARALGWEVLLDAAAYVPTSRLDLRRHKPDFLACSFYKMFGHPTGVGCLLVHNSALPRLANRCWYAGGTVEMVHPDGKATMLPADDPARYEDGTINFSALPAVTIGIQHLMRIGMDTISTRVTCLTAWIIKEMLDLRHHDGSRLVRIYGPTTAAERGGSISFNLLSPQGTFLPLQQVQQLADRCGVSLRTGCMCNPMAAWQLLHGSTLREMQGWFPELQGVSSVLDSKVLPGDMRRMLQKHPQVAGVVRISFGLVSTFQDAHAGLQFVSTFLNGN